MKKFFLLSMLLMPFLWIACSNEASRYIDLNTGKAVKLEKDESGVMVDAETKKPVYIYVDTKTNDTIYGKTGEVINGHVVMTTDNRYSYDADIKSGDDEYKIKGEDYKMKSESDGDTKIKDGVKAKTDGETGEKKVKEN